MTRTLRQESVFLPRSRRRVLCLLALPLTLAAVPAAAAQPRHPRPSAADIAAARDLGTQGVLLAEAGNCKAAIEKLSRAAALFAAPTIVEQLGACQVKLGRVVAGTENLQRVVRDKLADDASKPFIEAQQRARRLLRSTLPRIAHLEIVVDAPARAKLRVTIDGAIVPRALLGALRPTDPGTREVVARAPGFLEARRSVKLGEGATATIRLKLMPDPNAPADRATMRKPAASTERTISYVLFGLGGAAVATGSVLGVMAASKKSDLARDCPGGHCSDAFASKLDSARAIGTGSTVSFGVGLAAIATATYLFLTSSPSGDSPVGGQNARPHVWVGLGTAGIRGRF